MTKNNSNNELWWHICGKITYCLKYWSAALIMEKKKPQVSKKKVSFPSLKTDQGCSCKQPSYNKLAETSYHQILYWPWCHQQKFLGSWWFSFVQSHPLKVPLGFPYQNNIRHKDNQWNLLLLSLFWGKVLILEKGL